MPLQALIRFKASTRGLDGHIICSWLAGCHRCLLEQMRVDYMQQALHLQRLTGL